MTKAAQNIKLGLALVVTLLVVSCVPGCQWQGLNSIAMPGTAGRGDHAFEVRAQMRDVGYLEENSRVRVGDANVGTVTKIEREGWHALITMRLNGDVHLPANATATLGQTSLLGSLHVELAAPTVGPPVGRLTNGALIPLRSSAAFPRTDQTLAVISLLLNGGGVGEVQDIVRAFSTALSGRGKDLKSLIRQINEFVGRLHGQTDDIIAATESFNRLVKQLADQKPVLDNALRTVPNALEVLNARRDHLTEAFKAFGQFSALATKAVNSTKQNLDQELRDFGPILQSLADAGPSLTRGLSLLATFPWADETLGNMVRGDYVNVGLTVDLTLSRIDRSLFTGTRWEGNLTELEMQWGRTIGQLPSPYTAGNPLVAPYNWNQGP
ncbi:MCE family protein [Mycobacterium vicinigordonae]|uniref:MCE family protein n=1 Tax=Mycobacterium vicinigordonae TaxID=1719132 RepID=UPI0024845B69|nr:MCE family protein [Mycobacterium vicinigordonae]